MSATMTLPEAPTSPDIAEPAGAHCVIAPSIAAVTASLYDEARLPPGARVLDLSMTDATAAALPFADGQFDAVVSAFGAILAADPARAAGELVRVTRPGGTIALAAPSSSIWGTDQALRVLLGRGLDFLQLRRRGFRFAGAAGMYLEAVGVRRASG